MDSILNQDYPNIEMLIRDDGSKDKTIKIIKKFVSSRNISIIEGTNIGVPQSFFELLRLSSSDSDYFAFCDQDDVWQKDKLARAITLLNEIPSEVPSMYCARVVIVDERLDIIGYTPIPKHGPSFNNALVENIAAGCTTVINKAARDLLQNKLPTNAQMHDWWIYLVISATGNVIYDPEVKILYRQHSSNVVGAKSNYIDRWNARIKRFLQYRKLHLITEQAKDFERLYSQSLPLQKKKVLTRFIYRRSNVTSRLGYAFHKDVYRQSRFDDIILRILLLLDYI